MSDWSFSLRKGRGYNYESDSDSGDDNAVLYPSSEALSANPKADHAEETVEYKESPWTIAKINAVTRKNDPKPPGPIPASSHVASQSKTAKRVVKPSGSQRQHLIETSLPKQNEKPALKKTQTTLIKAKPASNSPLVTTNPTVRKKLAPLASDVKSSNESITNQVSSPQSPVLMDKKNQVALLISHIKKSPSPVSETYLSSSFQTPSPTPLALPPQTAISITSPSASQTSRSSRLLTQVHAGRNSDHLILPISRQLYPTYSWTAH